MMPRRAKKAPPPPPLDEVDLNQVVAYNVRAARELRGWTQDQFADRLEPYMGQRMTQAGVSSIERAWDGDRRREQEPDDRQLEDHCEHEQLVGVELAPTVAVPGAFDR